MKKSIKRFLIIVTFIIVFFFICNIIPPKKVVEHNPFISNSLPMVAAHRGGGDLNPENTLKAFKWCVNELNIDILEFDLYLTKDNYLVINHDKSINRTSDVEILTHSTENYNIEDHTLEELKNFNLGYKFKKGGEYPYRDLVDVDALYRKEILAENDLSIVTLDELFNEFYNNYKELLFIIEIKDSGTRGKEASKIFYETVKNNFPDYLDNIVASSFNKEVEDSFRTNYPSLYRGSSVESTIGFVATEYLKVNIFDQSDFTCLQIPMEKFGFNLTSEALISRAHRRGMAVQYWTINDEDDMRKLIDLGCDAIMTDNPELLIKVLNEYK